MDEGGPDETCLFARARWVPKAPAMGDGSSCLTHLSSSRMLCVDPSFDLPA